MRASVMKTPAQDACYSHTARGFFLSW